MVNRSADYNYKLPDLGPPALLGRPCHQTLSASPRTRRMFGMYAEIRIKVEVPG